MHGGLQRFRAWAWLLCAAVSACGGGDSTDGNASPDRAAGRARALSAAPASQGQWSAPIPLSLVPTAAANLPDGRVLLWSAQGRFDGTTPLGSTYTTVFDPATNLAVERLAQEASHNMFCPGTTNLPDGRLLVNGGTDSARTSIYDPVAGSWTADALMTIPRGYQANTLLQDGSVLTLGGSWSGGLGNKHAEVWSAASGWRRLTGVPVDPMVAVDPAGIYRGDNHMWLVSTGSGRVLHAGPSPNMNWIETRGDGSTTPAGTRGDDAYAINGSIAMYDIGKLLKTGGAPAYENRDASNSAHLIDVNGASPSVRRIAPMSYQRAFHNSVVLPNGEVLVLGGQTLPVAYSDDRSILVPELWNPVTEAFTLLPAMSVPRTYHSSALLLPDARVMSVGGGLCGTGCATNHPDLQIFSPHYLFDGDGNPAVRPVIASAPAEAAYGASIAVTTDSAVTAFSLVRLSSATHTVNNDQRRIPLVFEPTGSNAYRLTVPTNPGIVLPGNYMLFAMNADGVPSVAKTVRVGTGNTPQLQPMGSPTSTVGAAVSGPVIASGSGTLTFAQTGLPPGLSLDAQTGVFSGVPASAGSYPVTVFVSNDGGTVSTDFVWTVQPAPPVANRYVKLEALSEVQGRAWTTLAEFNVLDIDGAVIPRTGWKVTADSQEMVASKSPVTNTIDAKSTTYWHTQYRNGAPPPPHWLVVDLGVARAIGGFKALPRQDLNNGRIASWRFHVSVDGVNWQVVGQGVFADDALEKTVFPVEGRPNRWPTLATPANPTHTTGDSVSISMAAADPDGDRLSYAVTGLPPGVVVNPDTGLISGTPSAAGVYNASALVSDGRGGVASAGFVWTVLQRSFTIQPLPAPPAVSGSALTYTAVADAGSGARYSWEFGDGTAAAVGASLPTITHTFAAPGLYTVTLKVTDVAGLVKMVSFTQAVYRAPTAARPATSGNVVMQPVVGGNPRVWVVNQDGDSISVFDASTLVKLAEVPVGASPRSAAVAPDGRVWVTNKSSATLSIVDPATMTVAATVVLPRASMPFGVAFSPNGGKAAYVTLEGTGKLLKLDPATGAVQSTLSVGPNPRQLSVTAGSDRVLVSRFISPPLPGEATASVLTDVGGTKKGGEVVVVGSSFTVERTIVLQHSDRSDSASQGRGIPNYLGAAVVSPDGRSAWVPSKQDNVLRGTLRDGQNLDFQNTVRAVSSRIDLGTFAEDAAARVDHDNAGVASAAVFHPTGAYLFVALQSSRQVAVIDPARKAEILRLDVGRSPDGLAVSPDGLRLFVNNFMDRTLQVLDLTRLVQWGETNVPVLAVLPSQASEKLGPAVLVGKQFFYDARDTRLARDGYLSCAACHNDGGHDGRTWDMTGLGEGLRNTIALRGRAGGQGFRHWSGNFDETQDFEGQIRTLAQGSGLMSDELFNTDTRAQSLGTPKAGVSADLDALAAYIASLDTFAPSPARNADGSLTTTALSGKAVFANNCVACHNGAAFTDSAAGNLRNIGTLKASSGSRLGGPLTGIDVPTLRDAWATAPYLHDGSAATVADAVSAHGGIALSATDLSNVSAYVLQAGGEEAGPFVVRYVRLKALSEVSGGPWTSMAEFNLLDMAGKAVPRAGWAATVDNFEPTKDGGHPASLAIDGKTNTFWHTQWSAGIAPPPPHTFTVDMGQLRSLTGFSYLPRQDGGTNGRVLGWQFSTSADGVTWSQLAEGTFANTPAVKTVSTPAP